jgi:hypothetical protein
MDTLRECIEQKLPDWKIDTVDGWRMIDAGEKYGRIRYNEALESIKKYTDAGWVIDSNNIEQILAVLTKPI